MEAWEAAQERQRGQQGPAGLTMCTCRAYLDGRDTGGLHIAHGGVEVDLA